MRKVARSIEGAALADQRRGDGINGAEQHRIAVRGRRLDDFSPQHACGAGLVLHHYTLLERRGEPLADKAGDGDTTSKDAALISCQWR